MVQLSHPYVTTGKTIALTRWIFLSKVLFSCLVVSDSLKPHGLQGTRLSCQQSPKVCSKSCSLSQWCHPTISSSVVPSPAFNLSQHQGIFQWVSSSHQVAKVWSFSFNISPSNEYSRLISFRMDWLDLLAVQGTLKNLLQHHSLKASDRGCRLCVWWERVSG